MATIASIIREGYGKAGSNGAWRVGGTRLSNGVVLKELWHYGTRMLAWREDRPADPDYLDYSIGHGSVSDQGGMNQAFRILGIPLYFSRRGGAEIL